jgi:hypothetical protein
MHVSIVRTVAGLTALHDGGAKPPSPKVPAVQRAREAVTAVEAALLPLMQKAKALAA